MCSKTSTSPESLHNRLSKTSSTTASSRNAGGWQGGDYQVLLEGEGMASCDSSIGAWSEDGHRDHINAKKSGKRDLQKKKRSSSIIHGTLVMRKNEQQKEHLAIPASFLNLPSTANSDAFSASFSSPLHKFPSTPARSNAGRLVPHLHSPGSFLPVPQQLCQRAQSPLIRQLSQDKIDASPLDVASVVASGWAIEPEECSGDADEYSTEAASALIDSLLHGVQEGFLTSAVVNSPSRMTEEDAEDDDSQAGWETDDCDITPRLRQVWRPIEPSSADSMSTFKRSSRVAASQSDVSESTSSSQPSRVARRQSFIRVPSAIFPHTPSQAKAERRKPNMSITSTSSSITKRSRLSRCSSGSSSSLPSSSEKSIKRRSVHLAPTPRPMSRKSKYYSRPAQPGAMPLIKQQHLKGARGTFWSPMNSMYIPKDEDMPAVEEVLARQSTRYSRRSGQAWVRPRTFEVKDQYRVTVYPPQLDDFHHRRMTQEVKINDPDKTPTQAHFRSVQTVDQPRPASRATDQSRPVSRASRASISWRLPPGPPPTRKLPPVPLLDNAPKQTKRMSKRNSRGSRLSQGTTISTVTSATCSQCQQSDFSTCSCSQSYTDASSSYRTSTQSGTYSESQTETYSEGRTDGYTESQTCSCTDVSSCSCTMTRSSLIESQVESVLTPKQSYFGYRQRPSLEKASRVLGLPLSAPLHAPAEQPSAFDYADVPHSAPYFTSKHPPVLEPLPRISPFQVSFDHIFGRRSSKRWSRYSTSDASSRASRPSRCSTCFDGSELAYLTSKSEGGQSASNGTLNVSSSMSYYSDARSSSSSSPSTSPMSELDSDHGSEQDSDSPPTPTRSEYQSSLGLSESPGYRMSFIVSPMPQSAKRHSQMDELLMFSPDHDINDKYTDKPRMSALRHVSQFTSTTGVTTTSSGWTLSTNGTDRAPRSILKTSSRYRDDSQGAEVSHRRPTVSMAVDTVFKSGSTTFSGKTMSTSSSSSSMSSSLTSSRMPASSAPQRATLATSTLTKHDLEGRIAREESRRKRNESRLYALEKLEGKTKKSSLFFSLLSNASSSASAGGVAAAGAGVWNEQEEELASPLPQTPLTPAKEDLLELQRQLEKRQRVTQFQNNKAVSFTDVIGFDMGTYPKIPSRKRSSSSASSASDEQRDAMLKLQLKKLSTAIEARQYAKDKCIDK